MSSALCYTSEDLFPSEDLFTCQPVDPFIRARISFDDFDTPEHELTWVDVSDKLLPPWRVGGGRGSELEELDAYTCDVVFDDRDRELDPTNTSSPYAPDVVPNRRLWITCETLDEIRPVFKGYVDGFRPVWPEGQEWSNAQAHVRATDGTKILSQDTLTPASPDVVEYDEVIAADEPSLYYRHGEEQGTKVVIHIHKKKRRVGKGKKRRTKVIKTRHRHRVTRAEVEGISGPAGTYKNTPALGQPGAIAGDPDTAVLFRAAQSEHATITVDQSDLIATNRLTVEAWVKATTDSAGSFRGIVSGPWDSAQLIPCFSLLQNASGGYRFEILLTSGANRFVDAPGVSVGVWTHLAGTWDGSTLAIYVDGELIDTDSVSGTLDTGDAGQFLHIGRAVGYGYFDGVIDEPAIYEKALTAARVQAHYDAGQLGFTAATTGQRIGQVLTQAGAWSEWDVQPGTRTMPVTRYAGVQPVELVGEAAESEGDPAVFYFTRANVPRFLPSGYRDSAPYNTPSFVFDSDGTDTAYAPGLDISDEDAFLYNDVRVSTDGGHTARATDSASIARFGRKVYTVEGASLTDADADALAASLLARYKDPMIRITRFQLNSLDEAQRAAMLSLEIGDQVRVIWRPPGGGTVIDQVAHIESVELEQAGKGEPILGTFGISPR